MSSSLSSKGDDSQTPGDGPQADPPAQGPPSVRLSSYSDRLKMNVKKSERLSRKVLEITLEVDDKVQLKMEDKDAAKVASRIGIDLINDLEGYQICPGNSKKILFWLKEGLNIDRFCKDEVYKVSSGIRTGFIRPMDRREVTVTIKGLNFNTPDILVIEYLNKHGKVTNPKVIYDVAKGGPFKGVRNGDRKYQCDFSDGINLGSYHIIDGHKVFIFYSGQRKTCGRCFQTSSECPGGAIAKLCDEKKGQKVRLTDHMIKHWKAIGFEPGSFKLDDDVDNTDHVEIHTRQSFTPAAKKFDTTAEEKALYTGVIIKNIPEALPMKDITDMLAEAGVKNAESKTSLSSNNHKVTAEVIDLSSEICNEVIDKLNETKIGDNMIFCRGLSDLSSPSKPNDRNNEEDKKLEVEDDVNEKPKSPTSPLLSFSQDVPGLVTPILSLNQQKKLKRKQNRATKDASRDLNESDFDFSEANAGDSSVNTFIAKFGGSASGSQNNSFKRKSSPKSNEVEKKINNRN